MATRDYLAEDAAYVLAGLIPNDVEKARLAAVEAAERAAEHLRAGAGQSLSHVARATALIQYRAGVTARRKVTAKERKDARESAVLAGQPLERSLHSTGGSVVVAIPAAMLRALGWKRGDDVRIRLEGASIIVD